MPVTIPFFDVAVSPSTLIGLALLLIMFFSFFSVSFSLGGSLSPKAVAAELNACTGSPEGPTALATAIDASNRASVAVNQYKQQGTQEMSKGWNSVVNKVF